MTRLKPQELMHAERKRRPPARQLLESSSGSVKAIGMKRPMKRARLDLRSVSVRKLNPYVREVFMLKKPVE